MLFRPLAELSLRIVLLSLSLGSVSKEDNAHFQIQQSAQVAIFRLRTGHNRLKYHLFNRLQLKYTDEIGKMMAKMCWTNVENMQKRKLFWPTLALSTGKHYRDVNKKLTATFFTYIIQTDI